ncbi:GAF domain-containing protein [Phenylobacterium sp.]|uniref:GAF domain-containing protein n=1 Tax=Phenylobacterium sp. TaxID=1871053 RepID=UPI002FE1170A
MRQAPLPPATGPSAGALRERLERLLLDVEDEIGGDILTSILLVDRDGKRLLHGAGPSLPPSYNQAIDGVEIGPNVGSCGTAAYLGHPVYVVDIALSPLWADFRDLAAEHGLRACWSTPIENDHGRIVGTFAVYHRTPRGPTPDEVEAIGLVSRVAAKAIERHLPHGASPP